MKLKFVFYSVVICLLITSCVSQPMDYGVYNPDNFSEDQIVTLHIDQFISVEEMDGEAVEWKVRPFARERIVRIPSGFRTFRVQYISGNARAVVSASIMCQLEPGNTYYLKGVIQNQSVTYHVYLYNDNEIKDDVTFSVNPRAFLNYVAYVSNSIKTNGKGFVELENENFILTFEPDSVYTLYDKASDSFTEGKYANGGISLRTEVFLQEADIVTVTEQNYSDRKIIENAQTVLLVMDCSPNEVVYLVEKPIDLRGSLITFTIKK